MTLRPKQPFSNFGRLPEKLTIEDNNAFNPRINYKLLGLGALTGLSVAAFIYVARMQAEQPIEPTSASAVELTAPHL